jgi:SAM-dependent methyltransferase
VNEQSRLFDAYVERCDDWFRRSPGRTAFRSELRAIQALLADVPRPWLEVGVGTGVFARALGVDVGIDPARKPLARALERGVAVVAGLGQVLPFRDGTFGGILLIATLCFLKRPLSVLHGAVRSLRGDGALLLADIERESEWGRLYRRQAAEGHALYRVASFWSSTELVQMLADVGLEMAAATSTLRHGPEAKPRVEEPATGIAPGAGFVCLLARRPAERFSTPGSP